MINIFLLNWNSSEDIKICLEKILKSDYQQYRIILIDNDSREVDKKNLIYFFEEIQKSNKVEIHLVLNDKNFGYAGGNNRAYEYAKVNNLEGDILIINPDISVSKTTLTEMYNTLYKGEHIGGVMTRTLNNCGEIIYDYISMQGLNQRWLITNDDNIETDYLAGSCLLLRRDVVELIGLFNEQFFMYWEEVDLSFRIKRNNFRLLSTTRTSVIRKDNALSKNFNMYFYMTRNVILMKKIHKSISLFNLIKVLLNMLKISFMNSYRFKNIKYLTVYFKGLFSGITTKIT